MLDYNKFLEWVLIKEPTLKVNTQIEPPISAYSNQMLGIAFDDAYCRCKSLQAYMSLCNFTNCVYNYALHIAIMSAVYEVEVDEEGNIISKPEEALQQLYISYSANDKTIGITTSASSGGSSASSTLPKSITEGDLETSWLLGTPYGIQAEIFLEQLNGVII